MKVMDKFIISAGIKLKINFDKNAKLEIYDEHKRWREVSPEVFRSWTGERKVNGKKYEGPIYVWLTNHIYESRIKMKNLIKEDKFKGMMFYDSFYFRPQDQHFIYWTVKDGPLEGLSGQYYKIVSNFGDRATIEVDKLSDLKKHGKVKGDPTGAFVAYDGKGYKHARRF
jgi:hypothetical protein